VLITVSTAPSALRKSTSQAHKWARLYQTGNHYLDISLSEADTGAILVGQLISQQGAPPKALVRLTTQGEVLINTYIEPNGKFRVEMKDKAALSLELVLPEEQYEISF
jgi:hypothetical protein